MLPRTYVFNNQKCDLTKLEILTHDASFFSELFHLSLKPSKLK